ncbi:LCP family protein [Secundilactobacillus collinoides]|uniref:Cell envelope-related transcriptional attenuator n=2 Tax=Secundilactobacillus collinoides TaxID=33960 RepID=A0A0R2B9H1_SECCO|nr:LCP family protein [Secundilactobacillus collinoides]KRM75477.1 cell envelope-related transcriptional attenuator [Secundilactobacillus collinoides DSM 20515 = JCM 1123]KZL41597.1 LytR family transcriptional regulator [Secundilactobacillus collinoides]
MSSNNSNQDPGEYSRRSDTQHFKRRPKKHHGLLWSLLIIVLIVVTGGIAYGYHMYNTAKTTFNKTYDSGNVKKLRNVSAVLKNGKPFSILLMGTDTGALGRHDTGRTDTMIIATVNPQKKTAYLTSIPRDTRVQIDGDSQSYEKINAAYTIGGASTAVDTVQTLLDVPIDFYAIVNMGGLEKMVNAVGGVTVTPTLTFKYGAANVTKGKKVTLNGKQALDYSRMREEDPLGDYGRQKRQRQIIQKLVIKGMGISSLTRYKTILNSLNGNLKTDMTFNDMITIRSRYGDATHHIKSETLQGEDAMIDGISYQIPTLTELQKISNHIRTTLDLKKSSKLTSSSTGTGDDSSYTSSTTGTTTQGGSTNGYTGY